MRGCDTLRNPIAEAYELPDDVSVEIAERPFGVYEISLSVMRLDVVFHEPK